MKKLIIIIIIAAFFSSSKSIMAQTSFGSKASIQFSNIDFGGLGIENITTPSYINSFSIGLMSQTELGGGFFFRPELNYSRKGFETEVSMDVDIFNGFALPIGAGIRTKIDYVDVPLNLGYSVDLGKVKAQFYAGPTIGFATKGTVQPYAKLLLNFNLPEQSMDLSDNIYNTIELGANIGTSLAIPIRTGSIILDARYNRSITNFLDNPIIDVQMNHQSFAFGVGYLYSI